MKLTQLTAVLFVVLFTTMSVNAQTTAIPDPVFEDYLIQNGYDSDGEVNGEVLTADISGVTSLFFPIEFDVTGEFIELSYDISDFTGLEDFISLQEFIIEGNFSVSNFSIDFSGNPNLQTVQISSTENLNGINFLNNNVLTSLSILDGQIATIDISECPNLVSLSLNSCQLTAIDVNGNNNLESLSLTDNPINSIQISNLNQLEFLSLSDTQIEELDISSNTSLTTVFASNANLNSVNLQNGNNSILNSVRLFSNPNLNCILVDNAIEALNKPFWEKDQNAFYYDNSSAINDTTVAYAIGEEETIENSLDNWLNTAGYSVCPLGNWSFDYTVEVDETILPDNSNTVDLRFVTDFYNIDTDTTINATFTISNIAIDAGESNGNGGELCGFDSYNLNEVYLGDDFDTVSISQSDFFVNEPFGLTFDDTPQLQQVNNLTVDFPDTGAGSFSYIVDIEVSKQLQFRDAPLVIVSDTTFLSINSQVVLFETGEDVTHVVPVGTSLSLEDVFQQIPGSPDMPRGIYDFTDFFGVPSYSGPGVYTYNPTEFLTECSEFVDPVDVNIVELDCDFVQFEVPDAAFASFLFNEGYDLDGLEDNGEVVICDIQTIEELPISNQNIANLSGLENFTGLKTFSMTNNQSFDINVDFSENQNLESITIINTPFLFELDVQQNSNLKSLTVATGSNIDSVDLTNNTLLEDLLLINCGLDEILLGANTLLETIFINQNDITELNVSQLSALNLLNVAGNQLQFIDVSNNLSLQDLDVSNNQIRIANLNNGNNALMDVDLTNQNGLEPLSCVLVDSVSFSVAENGANWFVDDISVYTDDSICTLDALSQFVQFDGLGNQSDVQEWFENNGSAIVYSPLTVNWSSDFVITQNTSSIDYNVTFTAASGSNTFVTSADFSIITDQFTAGEDFEPVSGDVANGVEAEGSLCSLESYNIETFREFNNPVNFENPIYQNATIVYDQISGPPGATYLGADVDFPDTGAGSFYYAHRVNVSTEFVPFGASETIVLQDEAEIDHWLVIPFNPGIDQTLTVCENDVTSLSDLYLQFSIEDDVSGDDVLSFNPNDYWFDEFGIPVTSYNGAGTYTFNAQAFFPQCGGIPATVTVIEDVPLSAGLNGVIEIPVGQTVTEMQLFDALQGSPDLGGSWSPEPGGTGTYTYSHNNGACGLSTAEVVVTEETLSVTSFEEDLNAIKVYPNPGKDIINLIGNTLYIENLAVYDLNGQLIFMKSDSFDKINISHLSSGMYFLEVQSLTQKRVLKFFKN